MPYPHPELKVVSLSRGEGLPHAQLEVARRAGHAALPHPQLEVVVGPSEKLHAIAEGGNKTIVLVEPFTITIFMY